MTDLIRLLLDLAKTLVPVRAVWPWERGVVMVWGKYWKTVGPGFKFVIPGLMEVRTVSVVPRIETTSLQNVTLKDGSQLSYSASFKYTVTDAAKAYLRVDHFTDSVIEIVARTLSEELANTDPGAFDVDGGRREMTLEKLISRLNADCEPFGMRVDQIGFNNFIRGARTFRLITDNAVLPRAVYPV